MGRLLGRSCSVAGASGLVDDSLGDCSGGTILEDGIALILRASGGLCGSSAK